MKTETQLIKQIHRLRGQLSIIEEKRKTRTNKKLVGKCFKYRNTFGHGESWWLYARVTTGGSSLTALKFQRMTDGRREIHVDAFFSRTSGWEEISQIDFDLAWLNFIEEAQSLHRAKG